MAPALALTPDVYPVSDRDTLRAQIEAAIKAALDTAHHLLALLDAEDGDLDFEPEDPENGAREWCGSGAQYFDMGAAA